MSPGWQSSASQISASVSKRTPLTLPDFSSETFCSVIPMRSASSFERIFRRASMTSRLTVIGIAIPSDEGRIFISDTGSFHHDPGDRQQHTADNQRQIVMHRQGDNKLAAARRIVQRNRD